jgi:cyanophycinase-like exopeptidase
MIDYVAAIYVFFLIFQFLQFLCAKCLWFDLQQRKSNQGTHSMLFQIISAKALIRGSVFLPIFTREDAMRIDFAEKIQGAGLIYLSGGDPHYLAQTLAGTPVWDAIIASWKSGSSLAGCSAGAMAFGPDIPHFRKMKESGEIGFGLLPHIRVIPHYNKFFKWIPDSAAQLFLKAPEGVRIVGIDESTAIVTNNLKVWNIYGEGHVHLLNGRNAGKYPAGDEIEI